MDTAPANSVAIFQGGSVVLQRSPFLNDGLSVTYTG